MKQFLFAIFCIIMSFIIACNNSSSKTNVSDSTLDRKTAKEIIQIDTVRANKSASTFYAICADEHFGWCSPQYSTYDDANNALQKHKDSTGHTDNTVSNDCPFY